MKSVVNLTMISTVSLCVVLVGCKSRGFSKLETIESSPANAFEATTLVNKTRATRSNLPLPALKSGFIGFGAEKEGASADIFKVAGFSKESLITFLSMAPEKALKDFAAALSQKSLWIEETRTLYGKFLRIELSRVVKEFDAFSKAAGALDPAKRSAEAFRIASLFPEDVSWTAFMSFSARVKSAEIMVKAIPNGFEKLPLVALPGDPERYIDVSPGEAEDVWEIRFKTQKSFTEFERMIWWFQNSLSSTEDKKLVPFDGPGHVWVSAPALDVISPTKKPQILGFFRGVQNLMWLDGTRLGTIMYSLWNYPFQKDGRSSFKYKKPSVRSPLRYADARFEEVDGSKVHGFEFRSGMQNTLHRNSILSLFVPRIMTGDFENNANGFENIGSNDLFTLSPHLSAVNELVEKCNEKMFNEDYTKWRQSISNPVSWNWSAEPYASKYATLIQRTQTEFFIKCASMTDTDEIDELVKAWVRASGIDIAIRTMLAPKTPNLSETILNFESTGPIDVNKIDLGLELTSRFPLRSALELSDEEVAGKKEWLHTIFGLGSDERRNFLRQMAFAIQEKLTGTRPEQVDSLNDEVGHGHELVEAFRFKDSKNRNWRVEWDGVGRSYDENGNIVSDSPRGGHIEVVSPKFTPTADELTAVYEVFRDQGAIPSSDLGGGHINIDLAPFRNSAKALARFVALFHEQRGVMSLLFQSPKRMKSSEPIWSTPDTFGQGNVFAKNLVDFKGNHTELKKLFYDSGYFNKRVGRKTKYTQLVMTGYFQDVIPANLITSDFDLMNPLVPWRQTFEVDPNIRKMEFRMFNAPRSAYESGLQIRFVRAMLNFALNSEQPLNGTLQNVDYEYYVRNPEVAQIQFSELMAKLGLDPALYDWMLWANLSEAQAYISSEFYKAPGAGLQFHPEEKSGWGNSLKQARAPSQGLVSELRPFDKYGKQEFTPAAKSWVEVRIQRVREAAKQRENFIP